MGIKTQMILLLTVLLASFAQILLKMGVSKIGGIKLTLIGLGPEVLKIATSGYIMSGLALYVFSSYMSLVSMSKVPLNVFAPYMTLTFIIVLSASYFLFNEQVSNFKMLGFILIALGVIFIGK